MKRFIKKVIFFLLVCLFITIIPPLIIDPYNVFHWADIRNNGIEPNKNYIKTQYILHNPNKYDGFLFGSSRVGAIHVDKINDKKIYNMTYSSGTPAEHLESLKTFIEGGVNIDIVYMGIDSFSYTESPTKHYVQALRCPYEYIQNNPIEFIKLYLNPTLAVQSLETIVNSQGIDGYEVFYHYGWWCDYDRQTSIDWATASPSIGVSDLIPDTLQDIKEITDLCKKNNIELVVFTNPMYETTYLASLERDYLYFLDSLAQITNYYNFSGINSVTTNTDNFIDTSHYNAYIGDMIINTLYNNIVYDELYEQGFGWYVTSDNVNELIEILNQ